MDGQFTGSIIGGIVMEVRELQTRDKSRVWRTVVKIAFTGGVCDSTADNISTTGISAGDKVDALGGWCDDGMGKQHFLLSSLNKQGK